MDLKALVRGGDLEGIRRHTAGAAMRERRAAVKLAVKLRNAAAARALVDAGAKPDPDALFDAILKDDAGMVEAALATGLGPTADLGFAYPPVMLAIDRGKRLSLRLMLDRGVAPNWTAPGHEPLLHFAIRRERMNGPRRLYANDLAKAKGTPMNVGDAAPVVDLLIDRGADVNLVHQGQSPLAVAVLELGEDSDRVAMLRGLKASESGVIGHKLWRTVYDRDAAAADALLASKPPADELGSALALSVQRRDRPLAERLVALGADVNTPGVMVGLVKSKLPAAEKVELIRWLLGRGADPSCRDYDDATPLEWAQAEGQQEVAQALRAAGASMPRRFDYATLRGVTEPDGNESSLCVLRPAGEVADDVAAALGGRVLRDVYRVRCRPQPPALLVVQLVGHPWSHVLPLSGVGDLEAILGLRLRHDLLYYGYGKAAEAYEYTLWRGGAVAESYEYCDGVKFTSTLGTKPPRDKANPVRVIDKAFKRFDAWAIETGLTARPRGEEDALIDLVGIEPKDVAGAHVVEALKVSGKPPWG